MTTLHLASTSPRRAALVGELGHPVAVLDPGLDDAAEERLTLLAKARGLGPEAIVERLALAKLLAGLARAAPPPGDLLVAADTCVWLPGGSAPHEPSGTMLGKAPDRSAARTMLLGLAGTRHAVYSGVAVIDSAGRLRSDVAASHVTFRDFGEDVLATYLDANVWQGKAGAYGVQDPESDPLVESVEGSHSNVKGLPLELLACLLEG